MSRFVPALLACLTTATAIQAQESPPSLPSLAGTISGDVYTSPTGAFEIKIPVLPALGGTVIDNAHVVTFSDSFSTYVTIVAFPLDTPLKWELETEGARRDYLAKFFTQQVVGDFRRSFPEMQVEPNGTFIPTLLDGAFIGYLLLPGGSWFYRPEYQVAVNAKPPVAKRGNLLFVHSGFLYVVSTELAERVLEGSAYGETSDSEDKILHKRLLDIVARIRFLPQPVTVPAVH